MSDSSPLVGIVMGSSSDLGIMDGAVEVFSKFEVAHEVRVLSAHRTPDDTIAYGRAAAGRGLKVLIAGAGGAAHLPGVLAAVSSLPVIGVPVALAHLDGLDSLLSIVQMPRGVPVATVGVNNSTNAALLAVRIMAVSEPSLASALSEYQAELAERARAQDRGLADAPPPPPA